jgi:uncharacterized membrane protein required for colicin V production
MENMIDVFVILVIFAFAFGGFLKGMLLSLFDAISLVVAFIAANYLSAFIRAIIVNPEYRYFIRIKEAISGALGVEEFAETSLKAQNALIGSLNIPGALKELLMINNNSEIYGILNARSVSDYIASFLASAAISAIAYLSAFGIVLILINVVRGILGTLKKTAGFNVADSLAGAALGVAKAFLFLWFALLVATFIAPMNPQNEIFGAIKNSTLALWFYENNFLLKIISFF